MTSNPAKHRVVFILYQGVTLLDVTGPVQVFSEANEVSGGSQKPYEIILTSDGGGLITTDTGIDLPTVPLAKVDAKIDALVISGGLGVFDASASESLVRRTLDAASRAKLVASTCLGTFLLAATGLLHGRKATTHWRSVNAFRARHPDVEVSTEALVVRDTKFWSSGGVTAGMDLALAIVDLHLGPEKRRLVAGRLVLHSGRPGPQDQYAYTSEQTGVLSDVRLRTLHNWITDRIQETLTVERLAEHCGMSPRHFARVYRNATGFGPAQGVENIRVARARRLLEETQLPLKRVAHDSGFGSVDRLRKALLRTYDINPSDFRARFAHQGTQVTKTTRS